MGKDFVNQHIVPKRYLDRFATKIDGKYIIGTRYYVKGTPKLFTASTTDVGYIKNFYDVSDKDDPKYWEHYLAKEIDTLCGKELENIISVITLLSKDGIALSSHSKEVLSKIIVAQMMRVPSSVDYIKEIYPGVEKQVKTEVLSAIPPQMMKKYAGKIKSLKMSNQWKKEQFFNIAFAPERFELFCNLIQERVWVVYLNVMRGSMPFATSDNPVLVEGVGKKEIGIFQNGLTNPATCMFFPISPSIAVANYSRNGIMSVLADEFDGKAIPIDDVKFIVNKNYKIMEQAHHHSFIPQPFFDKLMNG